MAEGACPMNITISIPSLKTDIPALNDAFQIAIGDIAGNVLPYCEGVLREPQPVLMAGLNYKTPWTRDASINTWNGAGLLMPEVTKNTLLSVLVEEGGRVRAGGEYWDAIIWALGAWHQYLYTGDRDFLAFAYEVVAASIEYFEATEWNPQTGLFRGPACYGDGVAAYPDLYAQTNGSSSIKQWPVCNPGLVSTPGEGIGMQALSTNCLYAAAYKIAGQMEEELHGRASSLWLVKSEELKQRIIEHFWDEDKGTFRYLVDEHGGSEAQEGMGLSLAMLLGIADDEQARRILAGAHITPSGIPCLWPNFARYERPDGNTFGRHSGTVWPHIQAFWAEAALRNGRMDLFLHELTSLAGFACRDGHFAELYHPLDGSIYGGIQEGEAHPDKVWGSLSRQTWSATGFVRMILFGLAGAEFTTEGLRFAPVLPDHLGTVSLQGLSYRGWTINLELRGGGSRIARCTWNGADAAAFIPAHGAGAVSLCLEMRP